VKARLALLLLMSGVLSGAAALGAAAPPASPGTLANDPGTFGTAVDVNVVNVEVYATDAAGKPVTGLKERDFELLEDGRRVSISNFAALEGTGAAPRPAATPAAPAAAPTAPAEPVEPWNLIVFVDDFDLHPASRTRALQQVRAFLGRQLAPGDRVMVVTYDMGLVVRLPFSSDPAAVDADRPSTRRGGRRSRRSSPSRRWRSPASPRAPAPRTSRGRPMPLPRAGATRCSAPWAGSRCW
jgi:hypothetical protein